MCMNMCACCVSVFVPAVFCSSSTVVGVVLDTGWSYLGPFCGQLGTLLKHLEVILGLSRGHLGAILGLSQGHIGAILENLVTSWAILEPS